MKRVNSDDTNPQNQINKIKYIFGQNSSDFKFRSFEAFDLSASSENNTFSQEDIILSILKRKDTLAILPTGGGKSICFQ
jgi:superfamily II DNA or RNA helicase